MNLQTAFITEGKVRTYNTSGRRAATRTRRGEGGKDSIVDVAKAIADYASS